MRVAQHKIRGQVCKAKAQKIKFNEVAIALKNLNIPIYATEGSADHLQKLGVECIKIAQKEIDGDFLMDLFQNKKIDMVVNIPKNKQDVEKFNNRKIRQLASSTQCSLMTDVEKAVELFKSFQLLSEKSQEQKQLHLL